MEKIQIKLKECCLTCEHFDPGGMLGFGLCATNERVIACGHMEVCAKYQAEGSTLASESGGGVTPSEAIAAQGIRGVALFLADGQVAVVNLEGVPGHD